MARASAPRSWRTARGRRPVGRGSRPPLTLLGIGLLVAGLACLGWVGFQYFGTNVVSEQVFETETEQLRAKWQEQDQTDPKGRDQASAIPGDAIALLRIPAFGDDYEIPILNGTDLSILAKGVGHYSSTAAPGQIGNFAIAGHRVTHGQPFAKLLEPEGGRRGDRRDPRGDLHLRDGRLAAPADGRGQRDLGARPGARASRTPSRPRR